MKIKVCGMRNSDNIKDLIKLKIDFIGFIFHEKSSRNVTQKIEVNIPKKIEKVGVFVDKPINFIKEKVNDYDLDYVQLHGKEKVSFCKRLQENGIKIIKVFNVDDQFDFTTLSKYTNFCDYFLFDASGKLPGGNGVSFNWELLQKYTLKTPFLLSGGIHDKQIEKIRNLNHKQLVGIDINSGFEIKPALKNIDKINNFIKQVKI